MGPLPSRASALVYDYFVTRNYEFLVETNTANLIMETLLKNRLIIAQGKQKISRDH